MKDILRRSLAMLMSVVMTLSLFVGYLPTEAYAEYSNSVGGPGLLSEEEQGQTVDYTIEYHVKATNDFEEVKSVRETGNVGDIVRVKDDNRTITHDGKRYQYDHAEPDEGYITLGTDQAKNVLKIYYKHENNKFLVVFNVEGPTLEQAGLQAAVGVDGNHFNIPHEPKEVKGYDFDKWVVQGAELNKDDDKELEYKLDNNNIKIVYVTAVYQETTEAHYTVRHYTQGLDGQFTQVGEEDGTVPVGQEPNVKPKTQKDEGYEHYTFDASATFKEILADGKTAINLYYTRNRNNVVYKFDGTEPPEVKLPDPVEGVMYEATFTVADDTFEDIPEGYKFNGWTFSEEARKADVLEPGDTFSMPDQDVVLTGSFTKDEQEEGKTATYTKVYWFTLFGFPIVPLDVEENIPAELEEIVSATEEDINRYKDYNWEYAGSRPEEGLTIQESTENNVLHIYYEYNGTSDYYLVYQVEVEGDTGILTPADVGLPPVQTLESREFSLPTPQSVPGYEFVGWKVDGADKVNNEYVIRRFNRQATATAVYKKAEVPAEAQYTVKYYYLDKDKAISEVRTKTFTDQVNEHIEVAVNGVLNDGYKNDKEWYAFDPNVEGSVLAGDLLPDGSLELTVYYSQTQHTANYKIESAIEDPELEQYKGDGVSEPQWDGETFTLNQPPEIPGYTFEGWTLDGTTYQPGDEVRMEGKDLNFQGSYRENGPAEYKVQHYLQDLDGINYTVSSQVDTESGTIGTTAEATPKEFEGFTFDEQNERNKRSGEITVDESGEGDLVLKLYYTRKTSTVTYLDSDGNPIDVSPEKTEFRYGEKVITSDKYPRKYWNFNDPETGKPYEDTFQGWKTEDVNSTPEAYGAGTWFLMPAKNVTFQAVYSSNPDETWYPVEFVITGDIPEGVTETSFKVKQEEGKSVTLWDPGTVEGYTFIGWWKSTENEHISNHNPGDSYTLEKGLTADGITFQGIYVENPNNAVLLPFKVNYYLQQERRSGESHTYWTYDIDTTRSPAWHYKPEGTVINAVSDGYAIDILGYKHTEHPDKRTPVLSGTVSKEKTLTLELYYEARDDTPYKIKFNQQELTATATDGKLGYVYVDEEPYTGKTGSRLQITEELKNRYSGFEINEGESDLEHDHTIVANGSMVFELFYDRKSYDVTYELENHQYLATGEENPNGSKERFRFEAPVTVKAEPKCADGYQFSGWTRVDAPNTTGTAIAAGAGFDMPATDVTIKGEITARTDTAYKVNYILENWETDGLYDENNPVETIEAQGETGATVTADMIPSSDKIDTQKYELNSTKSEIGKKQIAGNGSTVVNVYYDRKSYKVTYVNEDGTKEFEDLGGSFKCNSTVPVQLGKPKTGYEFFYWADDDGTPYNSDGNDGFDSSFKMPAHDVTLKATYQKGRFAYSINYYLTGTEIKIAGSITGEAVYGETVVPSVTSVEGYQQDNSQSNPGSLTITEDPAKNVLNFYYLKEVTVKADHKTKVYGDPDPELTATVQGLIPEDEKDKINFAVTREKPDEQGVGDYKLTVTPGSASGLKQYYTITGYDEDTLTITPRPITIKPKAMNKEYDGTEIVANEAELTDDSLKLAYDDELGTVTFVGNQVAAGDAISKIDTYEILDGAGKNVNSNYNVTKADGTLTITPRPITIKPKDVVNVTYSGEPYKADDFEYVDGSKALISGDTLNVEFAGEATDAGTYPNASSIASYTITNATGDVKSNYAVTTAYGDIVISKRTITLTSETVSKPYDGTPLKNTNVTVDGEFAPGEGVTIDESSFSELTNVIVTGNSVGSIDNRFTYSPANANTDLVKNYNIVPKHGTLTVTPASLEVVTNSANKVYDGTALTNGNVTVTLNGQEVSFVTEPGKANTVTLPNLETIGIEVTGTQTEVGSNENRAKVYFNGKGNYTAVGSNYQTPSFEYGQLTVKENADEIVVTTTGGVFTYDGLAHRPRVTVSELPKGYTLERAESDAVAQTVLDGTVEAKCDELVIKNAQGEDVTDKLNIKYVNSRLIINRAPLYITTQSAAKEYDGEPLYAGVTVTGLVNDETVSVTAMGSQTEVGSSLNGYHVAWNGSAKVYNYEIYETLGTLTVTPVGQAPEPPEPVDETPPAVRVVETQLLEDEIVPLAGNTEKCCIMHFLLALAALATVLVSGHDTKKLQQKITELKKKESPEDGEDDGRTDGRKDDN